MNVDANRRAIHWFLTLRQRISAAIEIEMLADIDDGIGVRKMCVIPNANSVCIEAFTLTVDVRKRILSEKNQ